MSVRRGVHKKCPPAAATMVGGGKAADKAERAALLSHKYKTHDARCLVLPNSHAQDCAKTALVSLESRQAEGRAA
jgi:hypothetical protein